MGVEQGPVAVWAQGPRKGTRTVRDGVVEGDILGTHKGQPAISLSICSGDVDPAFSIILEQFRAEVVVDGLVVLLMVGLASIIFDAAAVFQDFQGIGLASQRVRSVDDPGEVTPGCKSLAGLFLLAFICRNSLAGRVAFAHQVLALAIQKQVQVVSAIPDEVE